jgi:hypothetical protein
MRAELLTHYEGLTDNYRQIDYQTGARVVYDETVTHLNRCWLLQTSCPRRCITVLSLASATRSARSLARD